MLYVILIISIIILAYHFKWLDFNVGVAGFENNNYYFQGNENDSMYVGRLIQPILTHKVNVH